MAFVRITDAFWYFPGFSSRKFLMRRSTYSVTFMRISKPRMSSSGRMVLSATAYDGMEREKYPLVLHSRSPHREYSLACL